LIGDELALTPGISSGEKLYITLFGAPISGLRIRLRRILPKFTGNPEKILDAGCGRAVFTYQLAKKFPHAHIVGVDTDEEQLAANRLIAKKARLKNISFKKADVAQLPYAEEFDMVLSVDNLEHIEDDTRALRCLAQALKPQGKLILHVPGHERRWFFFRFRTNFNVPGHFRPGYKLDEITKKVKETGLAVQDACYTYGWLETVSNNISYAITKAEAKNKALYALIFPILNMIAWCGRNSKPRQGAGVLVIAENKQPLP